jgi:AbrB family looped-hinge helix DNA binding protein
MYVTIRIDGGIVSTVTISPKYQVVIPKAIREKLRLKPGQKMEAIAYEERIELIPVRSARELRGFLEGIDTTVFREQDRV